MLLKFLDAFFISSAPRFIPIIAEEPITTMKIVPKIKLKAGIVIFRAARAVLPNRFETKIPSVIVYIEIKTMEKMVGRTTFK